MDRQIQDDALFCVHVLDVLDRLGLLAQLDDSGGDADGVRFVRERLRAALEKSEGNHCASCGNLLEPDEGHKSKTYPGLICDGCAELEK